MINTTDERTLRQIVREMNIGFSAPQNGGVDGASVIVLQNGEDPEKVDDEQNTDAEGGFNAQRAIGGVIGVLNHLLRDLEEGVQGDAQICELQKCCETLGLAIEDIGNNSSGKNQDSAYSGLNNQDPNAADSPGGEGSAEGMMGLTN